jgi:hypothetical protein
MKKRITSFLILCSTHAFAADTSLLERALSCKLKDAELPSLMRDLGTQVPGFAKPAVQYGAPATDVYQLLGPVTALGYSSDEIVMTPGRILMAVPQEPLPHAIGKLKLKESPFSPASRNVRQSVSVVAFQLSHKTLENKLLVGCEYALPAAGGWVKF